MNVNEYKVQKALGTIDYRKAAVKTSSKKVLASIVEDTQDRDAHAAVAVNSNTDVRTLTRLIIERDMPETILDACIWHPSVNLKILEMWMKRDYIKGLHSARTKLFIFQCAQGMLEGERIYIQPTSSDFEELFSNLKKSNKCKDPHVDKWEKFVNPQLYPLSIETHEVPGITYTWTSSDEVEPIYYSIANSNIDTTVEAMVGGGNYIFKTLTEGIISEENR